MCPGNVPINGNCQQNVNDSHMLVSANYMLQTTVDNPCVTWYYKSWEFGVVCGPVNSSQLIRLYHNGDISGTALCWRAERYAPKTVYWLEQIV